MHVVVRDIASIMYTNEEETNDEKQFLCTIVKKNGEWITMILRGISKMSEDENLCCRFEL